MNKLFNFSVIIVIALFSSCVDAVKTPEYRYEVEYEIFYPDGKKTEKKIVTGCQEPYASSIDGTNYLWVPCNEVSTVATTAVIRLISVQTLP